MVRRVAPELAGDFSLAIASLLTGRLEVPSSYRGHGPSHSHSPCQAGRSAHWSDGPGTCGLHDAPWRPCRIADYEGSWPSPTRPRSWWRLRLEGRRRRAAQAERLDPRVESGRLHSEQLRGAVDAAHLSARPGQGGSDRLALMLLDGGPRQEGSGPGGRGGDRCGISSAASMSKRIGPPRARITARSTAFCSSRMLPGQSRLAS